PGSLSPAAAGTLYVAARMGRVPCDCQEEGGVQWIPAASSARAQMATIEARKAIRMRISFILTWTFGRGYWGNRTRASKEIIHRAPHVTRALEIAEMSAVLQSHQTGIRNCARDVRGNFAGNEVVIARNYQRRNTQAPQPWHQIVALLVPAVAH